MGYHYLVERDGQVVAGRPVTMRGAHCRAAGMNGRSLGVAVIGNLEERESYPAQETALTHLLTKLTRQYGIKPERVLGHNEVTGAVTACPGRWLNMDELRRRLAMAAGQEEQKRYRLWRVQVGAFRERRNAERLAAKLREYGLEVWVTSD